MNLLIIDDEPLTVKALKENMPWKNLGIEEVYTAYEPRFARQIIASLPVHIILCDIEMPGENGIDFLRWMKAETDCDAVTLLLTCHDEFSYAKEGISLGVMEYLLKPIAYDELGDYVQKAAQKYRESQVQKKQIQNGQLWEQNRSALVRNYWQDFFNDKIEDSQILETTSLGFTDETRILFLIFQIKGNSNSLSDKDILLLLDRQLKNIMDPLNMLYTIFSPAEDLIYLISYKTDPVTDASGSEESGIIYKSLKDLLFSLQINQVNLTGCMEDFCEIQVLQDQEHAFLKFLDGIEDMSGFYLVDLNSSTSGMIDQAVNDRVFQEVTNYIKRHMSEDISRQDVADAVHLNADYLSKMFKKKTGLTLSEFIRQERLNYSRHLLLNSDMSINDIAMLLNFSTQSHFSSVFKKQYGISPADFRNSRL